MKKSLINTMIRQYGAANKWVVLFQDKLADIDDTTTSGHYEIQRWFAYCDINARG